jgi:hypothetical protein
MGDNTLKTGRDFHLQFAINETDTLAGTTCEIVAPCDGIVLGLQVIVQKAVTTGGVVTAKVGTTDVAGISVTIADSATKGTVVSDLAPTTPSNTRRFLKGDRLQIVPSAAFNTAGAVSGNLLCNTTYSRA